MNRLTQVAVYARVSSEQQAEAKTIASQLVELRERVKLAGFRLSAEQEFVDDGYSGSTLIRPALEQLRDLVAAGGVDKLFVHSPDRLARKYAYQVLLIDEFKNAQCEVVFLNRELNQSPEDELLLQVQGMVAEYERAKIMERSRRGKRHAAKTGRVSVLSGAPYGYRYIPKSDRGDTAQYQVVLEEARVVRQVFEWVGQERLSIGEVTRRLNAQGVVTRRGKKNWDRSVIWLMLKNPAYKGTAAFGKTRSGPMAPRLREQRGRSLTPRRAHSTTDMPPQEWTLVPVPALVSEELFEAVALQLEENRRRARTGQRGARYLLQGLVVCSECGYAYYGKAISPSARKHHERHYAYYRCIGTDAYRFGGSRICNNTQVRTDLLDEAVWQEVQNLLAEPGRLEEEYQRRLHSEGKGKGAELSGVESQINKLEKGLERLIDTYTEGLIERSEFEPRLSRLRERIVHLEDQAQQLQEQARLQKDLKLIIGKLSEFSEKVHSGLSTADWQTQRELIRALVKRVEVERGAVKVVFKVEPAKLEVINMEAGAESLQHCRQSKTSTLGRS